MANKDKEKKKFTKKLLHKYRLVILNEDTFEERLTFKLSRLNVFVVVGLSALVLIVLTTLLIAYTPLREYVPGHSSAALRKQAITLVYKTDSLERVIDENTRYFKSIQQVLLGDSLPQKVLHKDTIKHVANMNSDTLNLAPSKADSILRATVAQKEKYNVFYPAKDLSNYKLFPPIQGRITNTFDRKTKHYGVDISTEEGLPVKATADGTVIFAEWTVQTGYVVIVQHRSGLVSVYKHNSSLTKEQGDRVKAGEVIAITGNTGKFTTGPHLHFELWRDGRPIDPTKFLDFEQ